MNFLLKIDDRRTNARVECEYLFDDYELNS